MKYVKMLGLAAVAAAALMAFVGSSTASATVLCDTEGSGPPTGTTCPVGWAFGAGTTIHAVSEGVTKLTTSFKTIECNSSTVHGTLTNEGSATETPVGHIESIIFTECNCEVKVLAGGTLEVHWIEGTHNGTLTSNGAEVTATCSTVFGNVHCIYKTNNTDVGKLTGGKTAVVHVEENNIPRLATSGLCAEKALWEGTYKVTSPDTMWVTGHT